MDNKQKRFVLIGVLSIFVIIVGIFGRHAVAPESTAYIIYHVITFIGLLGYMINEIIYHPIEKKHIKPAIVVTIGVALTAGAVLFIMSHMVGTLMMLCCIGAVIIGAVITLVVLFAMGNYGYFK